MSSMSITTSESLTLKGLRDRLGITQEEMAARLSKCEGKPRTRESVAKMEASGGITIPAARAYAEVAGVEITAIIDAAEASKKL